MNLSEKNDLIKYLQQHGLYTKKSLGQNFLVDKKALDKIVAAAELKSNDCVIEVGPGLGVMTEELVKKAGKVVAVELDGKLAELLCERIRNQESGILDKNLDSQFLIHDSKLQVINKDILSADISKLTKDCQTYKVVANIPYYITSKIIRLFLEAEKKPKTIVLLTQKEVAERICAQPGDMSVLSISVQYYGQPKIVDIVPRTSFFPAPEVDSAILRIMVGQQSAVSSQQKKQELPAANRQQQTDFFRCVHHGFASRRKTLLNNLSAGYHLEKNQVLDILISVGLDDKTRAQELSVEKWASLLQAINQNANIKIQNDRA